MKNYFNYILLAAGSVILGLWSLITFISRGLPIAWCRVFDAITFHKFTRQIYLMFNGFYYQVSNNNMPTVAFLVLFAIIFILYFVLIQVAQMKSSTRSSLFLIVLFSILFRLVVIFSVPIHENDFYRYLWDGKSAQHAINPFKYAPADVFMFEKGYSEDYFDEFNDVTIKGKDFKPEDITRLKTLSRLKNENLIGFERIGHWQVPTIYPPVTQFVFTAASFLKQDSFLFLKFIFICFDLGVLWIVIALLRHFGKNPCLALIYGWSPLVIKEISSSGHYDSIAVFFVILAVFCFVKKSYHKSMMALSLSVVSKYFAIILLPILIRTAGWRKSLLYVVGGFALLYWPYFIWNETGVVGVFQGFLTYNEQWAYNSSIFLLIHSVLGWIEPSLVKSLLPAKLIAGVMYSLFLLKLMFTEQKSDLTRIYACFLAVAGLFIINPVGDPWYFVWVIPFLCLFPYRSWILLSGLLILSYLNFHSDFAFLEMKVGNFSLLSLIIYLPFFFYLSYELILKKYRINDTNIMFRE